MARMADLAAELEDNPENAELDAVRRHRYQEARTAGFSIVEACLFADGDGDVGELRKLVAAGCAVGLIRRIVL